MSENKILRGRTVYISEVSIMKIKELSKKLDVSERKLIELILRSFMSLSDNEDVELRRYLTLNPNKTNYKFNIKEVVWDTFKKFVHNNYKDMSVSDIFEIAVDWFYDNYVDIYLNNFIVF